MTWDLIAGALAVILLMLWLLTRRPSGLPPGPPLLPFLGNILAMDADPRKTFGKLRQQYGDIFSVYMFHCPVIVLNGYAVLKDALVKNGDVFSDRPYSFTSDVLGEGKGVGNSSGETWREHRRFTLHTLRDLGMGKPIIEDKIQEELSFLLEAFEDNSGQPFDCNQVVYNAVSNIICSTVFGKRHDYSDPVFRKFLNCIQENFNYLGAASALNIFPSLRFLPGDPYRAERMSRNKDAICESLITPNIEDHMKCTDTAGEDFIYAYVKEMKHRQQQEEDTTMNSGNLEHTILDLFVAGTETTSTTIRWLLAYLLNYPDVEQKCFQEIKENIGLNRSPSMKDKTSLPYLEATIMEVLRRVDIAPTSVPHAVNRDVQFHGYTFPKGVTVIPMLESVLQDPDVWGDPDNFRPERFFDDSGKCQKIEEFVPFSLGRRVCPGESLARMELFLFLASLIQRFEFHTADGVKPSLDGIMGFTYSPKPFMFRAVRRD